MGNPTPSLTFEDKIRAATMAEIPLPSPELQARLREQLLHRPIGKSGWVESFIAMSPIKKVALVAMALALLMVMIPGPQRVIAAIQDLLRYIPGIGFVETDRVLAAPVTVEREGISVTVQSMVIVEDEAVLVYYAANLPVGELGEYCQSQRVSDPAFACLASEPSYQLRTDDGAIYAGHPTGGYTTDKQDGTDWTGRVVFPSVPRDLSQIDFLFDVLPNVYRDMAPEDWVIPLQLEAINPDDELSAAYQAAFAVLTQETAGQPLDSDPSQLGSSPAFQDGVQLVLNALAIQENTLTLSISVLWENENWHAVEILDISDLGAIPHGAPMPHYVTLVDANGRQIPLVFNPMESPYTLASGDEATFIFSGDITGQELVSPLTLTLNGLDVTGGHALKENQPSFEFTPATDFQPGDCEQISQSLTLFGNVIEFKQICSVENPGEVDLHGGGGGELTEPTPVPQHGLELYGVLPPAVRHLFIGDQDCQREVNRPQENCGGGYSKPSEPGIVIAGQLYYYQMPAWPVTYAVTGGEFVLPGPWQIQVDSSEWTLASVSPAGSDPGAGEAAGNEAAHLTEETIPDGTVLEPSQEFIKMFTLENVGETTWNEAYQLAFYASPQGETLSSPPSIPLGESVSPGEEITVSIPLTAPQDSGAYTVVWQLVNANGEVISVDGGNVWIYIQVGAGGQASSANGITMVLDAIRPGVAETRVDLCFDLPAGRDWFPGRVRLVAGGNEYWATGAGPIGTYPFSCFHAEIPIGSGELAQFASYRIVMDKMLNGHTADNSLEICEQLKPDLKLQYPGLDLTCLPFSAGAYFTNLVVPPGYSELEINIIISDAIEGNILGPWAITVTH